ncbi:hypothetical protein PR048_006357 [Dryococelus australis]|uniref:Uncharacterized protein n=1 Tax=Dryococelus australis TaxID=614101 RepID=A0ABQ9IAS8_9NEOP|nr:hypothetical protein PR048_006357 [Dryococelus australis]
MKLLRLANSLINLKSVRRQSTVIQKYKRTAQFLIKVNHRRSACDEVKRYASIQTAKKPRDKTPISPDSDSSISDGVLLSLHCPTSEDLVITDSETDIIPIITSPSLSDILHTYESPATKSVKPRKKAINYRT